MTFAEAIVARSTIDSIRRKLTECIATLSTTRRQDVLRRARALQTSGGWATGGVTLSPIHTSTPATPADRRPNGRRRRWRDDGE